MLVQAEKLKTAAVHILKGLGAREEEAAVVAESLVLADSRGLDTHGVHLLTLIAKRAAAGMLKIPTETSVVFDDGATALLDGGGGLGQVSVWQAMTLAIKKARTFGIGGCLVRNTNNIGILSYYTIKAAREGLVGIVMSNAAPAMSPWGGAEAFFGTNPLSIAVPSGEDKGVVVLDMSSTLVARGKIRKAERSKEEIPLGWAFDEEGSPTTDADRALKGTLMPIGGAKGYGLALMIDIIAGLLSGASYGPGVITFHELKGPTGVGVFTLALDIERFMPFKRFQELIGGHLASIKSSRKAKGVLRIYLPGEIEEEKELETRRRGVEIASASVEKLNKLLIGAGSPLAL